MTAGTSSQQRQRWQRKYQHLLATALVANAFSKHRTSDVAFRTIARLYAHEVSSRRPRGSLAQGWRGPWREKEDSGKGAEEFSDLLALAALLSRAARGHGERPCARRDLFTGDACDLSSLACRRKMLSGSCMRGTRGRRR